MTNELEAGYEFTRAQIAELESLRAWKAEIERRVMEMKYVVVLDEEDKESLFIFPKSIDHDAFAEVLSHIKTGGRNWKRMYRKPVSAGFTDGARCYGRSELLGLDSRKRDTELLLKGGA